MMVKRFDLVRISSTERVTWVSGPSGRPASPQGYWIVVAGVGYSELLLAKDETLIRVHKDDVHMIASYDTKLVIDNIAKIRFSSDLENQNGEKSASKPA